MAGGGAEAGCNLRPFAGFPDFAVLSGGLGEGGGEGDSGGERDLHRREGLGSTSLYGGGGGGVKEVEGVGFALIFRSVGVPEARHLEGILGGFDQQDDLTAVVNISDCIDTLTSGGDVYGGDVSHFVGGRLVQSL